LSFKGTLARGLQEKFPFSPLFFLAFLCPHSPSSYNSNNVTQVAIYDYALFLEAIYEVRERGRQGGRERGAGHYMYCTAIDCNQGMVCSTVW
jgi:hypothetical protein